MQKMALLVISGNVIDFHNLQRVSMFIKSEMKFEFSFIIEASKPSFLKVLKTLCLLPRYWHD